MPIAVITSLPELQKVLVFGQPETTSLEFKEKVNGWSPKAPPEVRQRAQRETARDFSQLANAQGGYLVYGVAEDRDANGLKVAKAWAPIDEPEATKAWIDDALANYCVPSTFTREVRPVDIPGGVALVATIQPSVAAVYVWDREAHTIQCLTRTSTGKKYLNPNELERHIMDGSRASRLAFDEAASTLGLQPHVVVADGLWIASQGEAVNYMGSGHGHITLRDKDERVFRLEIEVDRGAGKRKHVVTLPYSLLRHVWIDESGLLTVMLGIRLVFLDSRLSLRPFT